VRDSPLPFPPGFFSQRHSFLQHAACLAWPDSLHVCIVPGSDDCRVLAVTTSVLTPSLFCTCLHGPPMKSSPQVGMQVAQKPLEFAVDLRVPHVPENGAQRC
jgi:hypothetical protein